MNASSLKILGIIGARSGSKGVPDKNIRPLGGQPLMAWIIAAAKKSKYINRLIVSTDSPRYAKIAEQYGAEVPHLRPKELSTDSSPDFEYIKYVVDWLAKSEHYQPDIVLRLLPTVPLQSPEDIDLCIAELIKDPGAHSALVIAAARQHPLKALKLVADGLGGKYLVSYLTGGSKEAVPVARQNYEPAYFRANVIACWLKTIKEKESLTGDKIRYHIIPQERAVDIDTELDFIIAEQLIKYFKLK